MKTIHYEPINPDEDDNDNVGNTPETTVLHWNTSSLPKTHSSSAFTGPGGANRDYVAFFDPKTAQDFF